MKRKLEKGKGHSFIKLTDQDRIWVEKCVKKLIFRFGENGPYDEISLSSIMT